MNSYDEDSDSPTDGYDPKSEQWIAASGYGKWITANMAKRNKKKDTGRTIGKQNKNRGIEYKKSVGTQCRLDASNSSWTPTNCELGMPRLLNQQEIVNDPDLGNPGQESDQLVKAIKEYEEQLKQAVEAQVEVGRAIKDGQKELENVVQNQARMIERMIKGHNDTQLTCIAQVSGLCDSVVNVTEDRLDSVTNQLSKLTQNLHELAAQIGHLQESTVRQLGELKKHYQTQEVPISRAVSTHQQSDTDQQDGQTDRRQGTSTRQQVVGIVDEYFDKEKRRKNVVVYNLPESTCQTNSDRMKEDLDSFCRLVREELHLIVSATKCYRVGKRLDTRPRLLIVTMESEDLKWDVLRQAPQLRHSRYSPRIFINPDLPVRQRAEARRLREELAQRKAGGERNIKIQRGRIVQSEVTEMQASSSVAASCTCPTDTGRGANSNDVEALMEEGRLQSLTNALQKSHQQATLLLGTHTAEIGSQGRTSVHGEAPSKPIIPSETSQCCSS